MPYDVPPQFCDSEQMLLAKMALPTYPNASAYDELQLLQFLARPFGGNSSQDSRESLLTITGNPSLSGLNERELLLVLATPFGGNSSDDERVLLYKIALAGGFTPTPPPDPPQFTLMLVPDSVSVAQGASTDFQLSSVLAGSGINQVLAISDDLEPTYGTITYPDGAIMNSDGSSGVVSATVTLAGNAPLGGFQITFTATGSTQTRRVSAVVVVTPFTPASIAGLQLWPAADNIPGVDGDAVATWADASGNGNDATQATSSKRPTLKTSILNGHAVVRFDGVDDFLSLSDPISFDPNWTYFLVAAKSAPGERIVGVSNSGGFPTPFTSQIGNGYVTNQQVFVFFLAETSVGFNLWTTENTAGSLSLYLNGSPVSVSGGSSVNVLPWDVVGAISGSSMSGDIAEILVYNRALSTPEQQAVEAYLGAKYGITIAP